MNYNPHEKTLAAVRSYFTDHADRFPGVTERLDDFLTEPSLASARAMMKTYFSVHQKDDIESLRMATATFADKRLVKLIVESILENEGDLESIAHRSYPHPIGFDKLVLYDDKDSGFKFRLHIYWRGNQRAVLERMHLHRFEMASAIVTGELTNHIWRVSDYRPEENSLLPAMELPAADDEAHLRTTRHAYSGYARDAQGQLHKKFLGECDMVRGESDTFVSGNSYAQVLADAHYVETNAETGKSNGDVCSTIYIHSGGLKDSGGRKMPVLFEDFRLANADQIIDTIPELSKGELKSSLERYNNFLQQHLDFYEWLYDPKHGRDLSVGMIAGYLISESMHSPHTIRMWIDHEDTLKADLHAASRTLAALVRGDLSLADISDDNRNKRYFAILLDKAEKYDGGREKWLRLNGDLVKEMWRYCGALKGEKPDVTVLKPMWEAVVGRKLPGGAHYGHIAGMIEAVFEANPVAMKYFREGLSATYKSDNSPTSQADQEIENMIRKKLAEYYPAYAFTGEEGGSDRTTAPAKGDRRWLVDPIDGTRNFLGGRDDFAISIACQLYKDGQWETTDGVISAPASGKIYWAEKNHGAYLIERDDFEHALHVSGTNPDLPGKTIDVSLRGFGAAEGAIINSLHRENAVYRNTGSAALMMAMVAGKGSDGAIMTVHDYDIAAAKLIASEAGAVISEFDFTRDGMTHTATIAGVGDKIHDTLFYIAESAALQPAVKASLQPHP